MASTRYTKQRSPQCGMLYELPILFAIFGIVLAVLLPNLPSWWAVLISIFIILIVLYLFLRFICIPVWQGMREERIKRSAVRRRVQTLIEQGMRMGKVIERKDGCCVLLLDLKSGQLAKIEPNATDIRPLAELRSIKLWQNEWSSFGGGSRGTDHGLDLLFQEGHLWHLTAKDKWRAKRALKVLKEGLDKVASTEVRPSN